MQKYVCNDYSHSFDIRQPNYGCRNLFSNERKKTVKGRLKTLLGNIKSFFGSFGDVISHETMSSSVPAIPQEKYESEGYFVYDEQYAHIEVMERYKTLLNDSKTSKFVEERTERFLVFALSHFIVTKTVSITTDGYRYEDILKEASGKLEIRIRRQRCLFHIEKDLAHKIMVDRKEEEPHPLKKLIKYKLFQTPENLKKIGDYSISIAENTEGKSEDETVRYVLGILNRYYGDDPIISKFLLFVEENKGGAVPLPQEHRLEKDNRQRRAALLCNVVVTQAQIQDEGRSAEDVILA